jgi:putative nucleotidyltransferase with HDIG domain
MRPDHPLQRRLQQEALGTYQHTLSVANLVEAAADVIGADSLLARVGTLYHDIGKMANPGFFIENRVEGSSNPHEQLKPLESATIIKAHVHDGLAMARSYRLPQQITAFVAEHHGTLPILFFLDRARHESEAANQTFDERPYFYNGPVPASRETAILMLADGCESAVRANRPTANEEIDKIVQKIIQQRLDLHQLDQSGLTLNDVKGIRESFVRTLRGMYHPRIRYPGDEPPPR